MARVGVLALQGAYAAHCVALARGGHSVCEVREAAQLDVLDGLVLPGGESTTMLKLIKWGGLGTALSDFVASGRPVLGTCAGLILAAREVRAPAQESMGWLDVVVERNAYGRQLDSFEAHSDAGLPLIFIRAPRIVEVGPAVEVLDTLAGEPVLVRQGQVHGACFHPELSPDHTWLVELFRSKEQSSAA
jgi:5'-phosphate synthase pdxT subunit